MKIDGKAIKAIRADGSNINKLSAIVDGVDMVLYDTGYPDGMLQIIDVYTGAELPSDGFKVYSSSGRYTLRAYEPVSFAINHSETHKYYTCHMYATNADTSEVLGTSTCAQFITLQSDVDVERVHIRVEVSLSKADFVREYTIPSEPHIKAYGTLFYHGAYVDPEAYTNATLGSNDFLAYTFSVDPFRIAGASIFSPGLINQSNPHLSEIGLYEAGQFEEDTNTWPEVKRMLASQRSYSVSTIKSFEYFEDEYRTGHTASLGIGFYSQPSVTLPVKSLGAALMSRLRFTHILSNGELYQKVLVYEYPFSASTKSVEIPVHCVFASMKSYTSMRRQEFSASLLEKQNTFAIFYIKNPSQYFQKGYEGIRLFCPSMFANEMRTTSRSSSVASETESNFGKPCDPNDIEVFTIKPVDTPSINSETQEFSVEEQISSDRVINRGMLLRKDYFAIGVRFRKGTFIQKTGMYNSDIFEKLFAYIVYAELLK